MDRPPAMSARSVERVAADQPGRVGGRHGHLGSLINALSSVRRSADPAGEHRFRSLFALAPLGIVVIDADGIVTLANVRARRMLSGDPVGSPVRRFLPTPVGSEFAWYRAD